MAISSPGIGSGLDINGIVAKLMAVESQPLRALDTKEAAYQAKLSAYGTLSGALSSFQSAVQGLNDPAKFQSLKASSSDATVASASASSIAVAGSYALDISKIAQSQKLVAAGQTSTSTAIGLGGTTTLTFDFGTISGTLAPYVPAAGTGGTYTASAFVSNGSGAKTVTIDATNNSLTGIRDAINSAKIGVTASIVNDGGVSPYRLVLSSDNAGTSNSIKISVAAGGDADVTTLLSYDPAGVVGTTQNLQQTLVGQNTEMTVNGVFVSKTSSTLTDVIPGVTLNALKIGTGTISVAQDSSGVTAAVDAFIKGYNDLAKTLKDSSSYDPATRKAGILQGDASVRTIQSQIRALLGRSLTGNWAYTNLSQVGITLQKSGSLALDSSKLTTALSANPIDVAALFSATGKASDSLVSYVSSTSNTKAGTFSLEVSQLATQGQQVGSAAAGLTITTGVNDTLSMSIDGVAATVTLAAGAPYASYAALAAEVQAKINGASALSGAGISVAVTEAGGFMTLTSNRYGSTSSVSVSGTAGATNLLGATPTSTAGVDVAGTLDGAAGTGSGQNLTGAAGNAEGLKLLITGGAAGAGVSRGTVGFSQGYAYQLNQLISSFLDSTGTIAAVTEGTNRSIKDIGNQRDVFNRRLANIEAQYRKQFTALDVTMASMSQTSSYLTQQLAALSSQTK
ncbi:MAG: flagellar filament capping protein FliD [Nitrosomonadales bacterium]|nr:flagellar filament capping protein FliD [Nitrosomonadales bacterium]